MFILWYPYLLNDIYIFSHKTVNSLKKETYKSVLLEKQKNQ